MSALTYLVAIGTGAALSTSSQCEERPVTLAEQVENGGTTLQVIGSSSVRTSVSYQLTVSAGSGNRVSQSSRAELMPGERRVLSQVRVSSTPMEARLRVQCENGEYAIEMLKSSEQQGAEIN